MFATSTFSRVLVILMVLALLLSLFFLIKKQTKAIVSYLSYLGLTLVQSLVGFVVGLRLVEQYVAADQQASTRMATIFGLVINLVLFGIFLLVIYLNNRPAKDKDKD